MGKKGSSGYPGGGNSPLKAGGISGFSAMLPLKEDPGSQEHGPQGKEMILRQCQRGHLVEIEEGAQFTLNGVDFPSDQFCLQCWREKLLEEFPLSGVKNPEVEAAYRLGGFVAASALAKAQALGNSAEAVEAALATLDDRELSAADKDWIRRVTEEVVLGKK